MNKRKLQLASTSRAISLVVLMGFLCIQFHSLSHIDLSVINVHNNNHQTESFQSVVDEHSSEEQGLHIDCPECILTQHIQADVTQSSTLHLSQSFQIITTSQKELLIEHSHHTYQLRAPPFYII